MNSSRSLLFLLLLAAPVAADEPLRSGPKVGQRPGPYSALVAVGPQRGQQHCFVCEAGAKPTVIVFARTLNAPLGKLVNKLDAALLAHKADDLRVWMTLLTDDATAADPQVVAWARQHALNNVPIAVFEDPVGPPTYLLARVADVTVLLSVRQRVVAAFAFRADALTEAASAEVLAALPRILPAKK